MESVDVYWSFRSPYSYLATPGMLSLSEDFAVKVDLRVVLPVAIRAPETLFSQQNAHRTRYIQLDWPRRARFLNMSDRWPNPDPIVQDLDTLEVAEQQPHIYRLSNLGVEAQRRGLGIQFAFEISHLLFGGVDNWHEGDHIRQAADRAGLVLSDMENSIDADEHLQEILGNQKQLETIGHWGVPTFVYDHEPFFGQDRIDTLRWHLENKGLKR